MPSQRPLGCRPEGACTGFRYACRFSRRQLLQAGGLGLFGLGLADLVATPTSRADSAAAGRPGRARSCILLFMWGGPSQLDTWDPKPDAPAEVRGEFPPVATTVPGVRVSEHFP